MADGHVDRGKHLSHTSHDCPEKMLCCTCKSDEHVARALSRLWYVGSLVPSPNWVLAERNSQIFKFF